MLKGFKDFILRGNVVELATAVIVGAAFTGIVTAFTTGIINPLLAAIPSGSGNCGTTTTTAGDTEIANPVSVCGLGFQIDKSNSATFLDFGGLVAAIVNFLIVAAVIYFIIIVPYNKLASLGKTASEEEITEVALLTEIRDLLAPNETSAAKERATALLPDHLNDPSGPPSGGGAAVDTSTKRIATPAPDATREAPSAPASGPFTYPDSPRYTEPASYTAPAAPYTETPSYTEPTSPYSDGPTTTYPSQPSSGGQGATPSPAPGSYPPPGNYPPGQYPAGQYPPAQYPGDPGYSGYQGDVPPDAPGRHSR